MLRCMRTTIRINDHLFAEVKRTAVETNRTLTAVIEDALREMLARRRVPHQRSAMQLPTFAGSGLQPGVDLDDSAALLDLMEGTSDRP